jgi:hypothetical protein
VLEGGADRIGVHPVERPDPVEGKLRREIDHESWRSRRPQIIHEVAVVPGDPAEEGVQLLSPHGADRRSGRDT